MFRVERKYLFLIFDNKIYLIQLVNAHFSVVDYVCVRQIRIILIIICTTDTFKISQIIKNEIFLFHYIKIILNLGYKNISISSLDVQML
jgi:hypothetical protein